MPNGPNMALLPTKAILLLPTSKLCANTGTVQFTDAVLNISSFTVKATRGENLTMKLSTKDLGDQGENLAALELQKRGYQILEHNYRKRTGEIDLIAQKDNIIYFVEVKAQNNLSFSAPADKVNARKRQRIANTAAIWFAEHGESDSSFLVAEVDLATQTVVLIEDFLQ